MVVQRFLNFQGGVNFYVIFPSGVGGTRVLFHKTRGRLSSGILYYLTNVNVAFVIGNLMQDSVY